jgi:3-oxoacyl-[acyl-carrier protein] reductase
VSEPPAASAQRYVITGAAGAIGGACAMALARDGAQIVIADLDSERLTVAAEELGAAGASVRPIVTDVTDAGSCSDLAAAAVERMGGIDGAVFAAGVARHVPLLQMSLEQWESMLAVHLTGAFLCLQAVGRVMVSQRSGSMVYVASSVAAGLGPPRQAHYVAAKAGALGLVRAAARELGAYGVRVNATSPGFTDTSMNSGLFSAEELRQRAEQAPLGRVAEPADVALTAEFLLGEGSGFMTGQTLHVNGGAHMPC